MIGWRYEPGLCPEGPMKRVRIPARQPMVWPRFKPRICRAVSLHQSVQCAGTIILFATVTLYVDLNSYSAYFKFVSYNSSDSHCCSMLTKSNISYLTISRDSPRNVVTRSWIGQQRKRGSIPSRGNIFFSASKTYERL